VLRGSPSRRAAARGRPRTRYRFEIWAEVDAEIVRLLRVAYEQYA
jgi:hypothetical protein